MFRLPSSKLCIAPALLHDLFYSLYSKELLPVSHDSLSYILIPYLRLD